MNGFTIYVITISEAKNATQFETSSPVPRSPAGILLINFVLYSSGILSVISVFIKPGETQFILIFFFACSRAKLFENATIPALMLNNLSDQNFLCDQQLRLYL